MVTRAVLAIVVTASALMAAACGGSTPSESPAPEASSSDASHTGHAGGGRVYFASPKDGETVKNPVQFEFANENVTIAAVPPGDLTESRPGMAHYHLGIDTDCTPVGEVIPRGVPTWVHFGTGSNTLEYPSPTTGMHKFVLQAGDDQHRAIEGLCETITINVTE